MMILPESRDKKNNKAEIGENERVRRTMTLVSARLVNGRHDSDKST